MKEIISPELLNLKKKMIRTEANVISLGNGDKRQEEK